MNEGPQHHATLARRLVDLGYAGLFECPGEHLDALWGEPGAPEALATLALDPEAPELARFLAAEALSRKQSGYPPEEQRRALAPVYAAALARGFTGPANAWGLPGEVGGLAGDHFVALGEGAIPELAALLDNRTRLFYEGSQEATLGNHYRYRVKDLAAFFAGEIRRAPFQVHEDPEARDEEIEGLKSSLGS